MSKRASAKADENESNKKLKQVEVSKSPPAFCVQSDWKPSGPLNLTLLDYDRNAVTFILDGRTYKLDEQTRLWIEVPKVAFSFEPRATG